MGVSRDPDPCSQLIGQGRARDPRQPIVKLLANNVLASKGRVSPGRCLPVGGVQLAPMIFLKKFLIVRPLF